MIEYCQIELTQGRIARVSPEDFEELSRHNWCAHWSPNNSSYYAERAVRAEGGKRKTLGMHRAIMNPAPGVVVDHVNRDTLDNRRDNLRLATTSQNNSNCRVNAKNTSGFKGVHYSRSHKRWAASIKTNGKTMHLGYYASAELAHESWLEAAKQYHGEFARAS